MKQNKHNNLYGCVFYFKWQTSVKKDDAFSGAAGVRLSQLSLQHSWYLGLGYTWHTLGKPVEQQDPQFP